MIVGSGSINKILTIEQIFDICKEGFNKYKLNNKRLLFIIPDQTRTAPIDREDEGILYVPKAGEKLFCLKK